MSKSRRHKLGKKSAPKKLTPQKPAPQQHTRQTAAPQTPAPQEPASQEPASQQLASLSPIVLTNNVAAKRSRPYATTILSAVAAILSLLAAILSAAASLATFWPRITVEHSGTLANPASIVFSTTINSYIPLRYPSIGLIICDVAYGPKPPNIPPSPCLRPFGDNMPHSPPPDPDKAWLDLDERVDDRLEDYLKVANTPIARANIIVTVGFYLWYIPYRF
jgi:hypothetical protein